jgi:hypothetical protein
VFILIIEKGFKIVIDNFVNLNIKVNKYEGIKTNIGANLAAAGIALTDMTGINRPNDGGTVAP